MASAVEMGRRQFAIEQLYKKYLGRDPEPAGLQYWLNSDQPLTTVEWNIANSTEGLEYAETLAAQAEETQEEELDIFKDTIDDTTASGDRLYDYTNQRETGDASNLYWNNYSQQLTEDELRAKFNAKDNGQLREAFGSFDNYLAYMDERQDLIDAGELKADWWNTGVALIDPTSLGREAGMDDRGLETTIVQEGVNQAEQGYAAQADLQNGLYQKYTGNSGAWYNNDGDKFEWNGTSFVKTAKVDDHNMGPVVLGLVAAGLTAGAESALAGGISTALGTGTTATQLASTTIANVAKAALTGGDLGDALVSSLVTGGLELSGATDILNNMVATGNASIDTILGDVVKAGTQELILTGEVTPATLVQAGLVSSIKEGVNYIQEALSPEQLQEVVVTATKKGQDLGNGNYLLDTGAVINDQGIVGYDAGNGFVDTGSGYLNLTSGNSYDYEIDTDGDGQITSNDFQEVVANPNVYGDVSFDLPSSGGIAFDYTNPDYLSQMDKWSDSQVVDQLQQAGFDVRVDSETGELYLEGNITSDNEAVLNYITQRNAQNFQEVNFVDYGNGVVADKSQKYTLGTDGNGNHYKYPYYNPTSHSFT